MIATTGTAVAGVTLKMEGDRTQTIYIQGNKMRIESAKGSDRPEGTMIFDGDAQQLIHTDPAQKTYSVVTAETMQNTMKEARQKRDEAMAKMTPEQRKQMEDTLAKLPPEQRKRMEQMMSGKTLDSPQTAGEKKDDFKWERTGEKQTVAGFPCEGFKEVRDGKVDGQGCYIPWDAGALSKDDLGPMLKLQEFFSKSGLVGRDFSDHAFGRFWKLPGFPGMWSHVAADGQTERKMTLTSVKRGNISADQFAPPAGFTKSDKLGFGK